MTSTDARRPAALPCSLRLAIGGALIALMSLNAQAEDGKTAPPPRRIFCWARCSMMSRARNCFLIRKRSLTPFRTAIR
ncbi:hypothetical protein IFY67_01967 [Klebsiella pneumoniae]|nr:hypothetical protein IFY67_01967 [Klebsiella pneumoniae]